MAIMFGAVVRAVLGRRRVLYNIGGFVTQPNACQDFDAGLQARISCS
jgi:hypothetical protein